MRTGMLVMLLACSMATAAEAQTGKHFSLGTGITLNDYSDPRFRTKGLGFTPLYQLSKGHPYKNGWEWDVKTAFGVSAIDVPVAVGGTEVKIGRLRTIPVLVGVTRAYRQGPMKVGGFVTGGPSFNNFAVDAGAKTAFEGAGSSLDAVDAKTSIAFRPGVYASYDLSSTIAVQGSMSYVINRPTVTTRIDGVSTSETWNLDHSTAALGLVLGIF